MILCKVSLGFIKSLMFHLALPLGNRRNSSKSWILGKEGSPVETGWFSGAENFRLITQRQKRVLCRWFPWGRGRRFGAPSSLPLEFLIHCIIVVIYSLGRRMRKLEKYLPLETVSFHSIVNSVADWISPWAPCCFSCCESPTYCFPF